ncbi:hypothetical protein K456DRAFT_707295 [Colletotrichum gloeosporioides 23]|nr:hypothetical protein K456DRAFT_707295 [Colletotrichum gloeosporioides 23]
MRGSLPRTEAGFGSPGSFKAWQCAWCAGCISSWDWTWEEWHGHGGVVAVVQVEDRTGWDAFVRCRWVVHGGRRAARSFSLQLLAPDRAPRVHTFLGGPNQPGGLGGAPFQSTLWSPSHGAAASPVPWARKQRVIVSSWCRWAAVMTVVRSSVDTPGSHGPAWKLPLMETDDEEDDDDSQWGRRRSVAARVRSTVGRATSSWLADGTEGGRRRETARQGVDGFVRLREWW